MPSLRRHCPDWLQFVNEKTGWISCGTQLMQTQDGGVSWQQLVSEPVSENDRTGSEYLFLTDQIGWRFGTSRLEKTLNGGVTWGEIPSPFSSLEGFILHLEFDNDGRSGWLVGEAQKPILAGSQLSARVLNATGDKGLATEVFRTTDNGETWVRQDLGSEAGDDLRGFEVVGSNEVWLIAGATLFHYHKDRWQQIDTLGRAWGKRFFPACSPIKNNDLESCIPWLIYFYDATTGWLSYRDGTLAQTVNGGKTWRKIFDSSTLQTRSDVEANFIRLHFSDPINGWGITQEDLLYETIDGGRVWREIGQGMKFQGLFALDSKHCWVVSKEGLFTINQ